MYRWWKLGVHSIPYDIPKKTLQTFVTGDGVGGMGVGVGTPAHFIRLKYTGILQ